MISFLTKKPRLRGVQSLSLGHTIDQASKGESTLLPFTVYDKSVVSMSHSLSYLRCLRLQEFKESAQEGGGKGGMTL